MALFVASFLDTAQCLLVLLTARGIVPAILGTSFLDTALFLVAVLTTLVFFPSILGTSFLKAGLVESIIKCFEFS